MKTTVVIDDVVFGEAKRRAAELQMSFSALVTQALREALSDRESPAPFRMPTFGGPGQCCHEAAELAKALSAEEASDLGR